MIVSDLLTDLVANLVGISILTDSALPDVHAFREHALGKNDAQRDVYTITITILHRHT